MAQEALFEQSEFMSSLLIAIMFSHLYFSYFDVTM